MPRALMTAIPTLPAHCTLPSLMYDTLRRRSISGLTIDLGRG
ncbi:hypothetical protein [Streptomyces gibsoniae]|uniref:Uncharacterized protein n=1 Tax=Streptomyces gibsoniae TaxID=3075529 RepID=A0ABU2U298_9ACTN|nr:hypothetical protein [Streptomyces sp. DSM 41699]MDT0467347.1 hypothetical protein [Streptomyces sp. DSM 41699]